MLLDKKLFPPFSHKGTYYCQDECCIYYGYKTNRWMIMLNGELIQSKEHNTISLIKEIKNITQELNKEKLIIFVNDLRVFMAMFPNGKIIGKRSAHDNTEIPIYYETKKIQFRNFSLFHVSSKAQGISSVVDMFDYLRELSKQIGYDTINACRYTAGWVVKRICSKGIEEELKQWNYDHKHFMNTVTEYNDMLCGCKTGLLKACKGVYKDVMMIDLKSAYLSKFFHYEEFPIGRNRCYTGINAIRKLLKNEWFHVVIDNEYDEFILHSENGKCGFYKADIETYKKNGIDLISFIVNEYKKGVSLRVYDNTEYGKLPDFYMERPKMLYQKKQSAKGIYKDAAKVVTELFYGKALQKQDFTDDKEVYRYYTRPENFVRPEWSMIVNSLVRLQMAEMIQKLGGSYYHDTDGIETEFTPTNARIVVAENKKIEKFNEEHNLPLNLGTWEIESLHATINIIGQKQRMFIDDNGCLEVKVAGIDPKSIAEHMHANSVMNPIEYFSTPRIIDVPNGYHYVKGYGFIEAEKKKVLLGRDD